MTFRNTIASIMSLLLLCSCGGSTVQQQPAADSTALVIKELNTDSIDSDQYVLISTSMGDMTVKLYRDAPMHRKNFINLVMNGYYDGQIFYRVLPGELIQTGDYLSRISPDKPEMGKHDVDYTIGQEIDPARRWHKRGALAAASMGSKGTYSSGAHFYIIAGGNVTNKVMEQAEKEINSLAYDRAYIQQQLEHNDEIRRLHDNGKKEELNSLLRELKKAARASLGGVDFKYSSAQRRQYLNDGGTPQHDADYTVFGEVIEGLEVVDSISRVDAYPNGLPRKHVVINKVTILEDYVE